MPRLSIRNLTKAYPNHKNGWSQLLNTLLNVENNKHYTQILHSISFDIQKGESLALLGRNGAGKSTLLKVITKTTHATKGDILCNGRMTALIELGLGMNAELTGRENALLGCKTQGIEEDLDEYIEKIRQFSELNEWFEQPVRLYSSGMHMRLAFSIATVQRPDILVVDEAFAVGDLHFQHKSADLIKDFQSKGTSLILVSHDLSAVKKLCDRAIILENGTVLQNGPAVDVADYYFAMITQEEIEQQKKINITKSDDGYSQTESGNGGAKITKFELFNEKNNHASTVQSGEMLYLKVEGMSLTNNIQPVVGFMVRDLLGTEIFGTNSSRLKFKATTLDEGKSFSYTFSFPANFGEGSYNISLAIVDERYPEKPYTWVDRAIVFEVPRDDNYHFKGVCRIPVDFEGDIHNKSL